MRLKKKVKSYYCSIKRHYYYCTKNEYRLLKKYIKEFCIFFYYCYYYS